MPPKRRAVQKSPPIPKSRRFGVTRGEFDRVIDILDTRGVTTTATPLIVTALTRGIAKRCPHCGRGSLFLQGWRHAERCTHCGLVYERNPGDTWAFTIIGDRLPVGAIIILIYFGIGANHRVLRIAVFIAIGALLIWTAPNRWGVGIALHYLSRVFWPEPSDPLPPSISR